MNAVNLCHKHDGHICTPTVDLYVHSLVEKQHIFYHLRSIKKISAEARVVGDPRPTVVVDFDSLGQPAVCWELWIQDPDLSKTPAEIHNNNSSMTTGGKKMFVDSKKNIDKVSSLTLRWFNVHTRTRK